MNYGVYVIWTSRGKFLSYTLIIYLFSKLKVMR